MKTLFGLLVAIGIVYAFYSGAVAAWSYVQLKDIIEESVAARQNTDRFARANRVKEDILKKAPASGVALDDRDVLVTEEDRSLRVQARWSYPVIVYKGDVILAVPISYDKSFPVSSAR